MTRYLALFALLFGLVTIAADRPNIILVITDDQGYGDLGCHGNPIIKTPHIDKFYTDAVRLTDYHVSPTCAPSRGALMCGQPTDKAGPWHTINGRNYMRKEKKTLPETLAKAGYATGHFGKWHLGDNYPYRPQDRGFQHAFYHGGGGVGQTPDYFGNDYNDDTYFLNGKPVKHQGYCTDIWFGEALKWIETNKEKPFFAYITTNAPHGPLIVGEKYKEMYANVKLPESDQPAPAPAKKGKKKKKGGKGVPAAFYGMITNIDENFGIMEEKLAAWGLTDNTIVIFTTDNGSAGGSRVFNAGMSGGKGSNLEGGHRVPFIMRWPGGKLTGGKDITNLTAHIDVMPTLLDLCGVPAPKNYQIDGKSLRPLFDGKPFAERVIVTDSQRVYTPIKWKSTSVMSGPWRLLTGDKLYNINDDPGQRTNIADKHPEVFKRLHEAYDAWWSEIEPGFAEPTHVIVGTPHENPSVLTSHDWRGKVAGVPWNQNHVKSGTKSNGYWEADFAAAGDYRISLARWPQEADRAIRDGSHASATKMTLVIDGKEFTKTIAEADKQISFNMTLKAGQKRIQGWIRAGGKDISGPYYCTVEKL
ncbi:MAG: arylsulfatase A-like enzyme [Rhodothermales bacterium]|jgi:arylsulfatase A-like enzyme